MADPGDADFAFIRRVWNRFALLTIAFLEDLRQQAVAQEMVIPPRPSFFRQDACIVGTWLGFGLFGSRFGHGDERKGCCAGSM